MTIWDIDLYRRPVQDSEGQVLWELAVCDPFGQWQVAILAPQNQVNTAWLSQQLQQLAAQTKGLPDQIRSFRPQSVNLLEPVCSDLGILLTPTRHTLALKQWLKQKWQQPNFDPLALDRPAPVPMPEQLWGKQWQFAALPAVDLVETFRDRPIPVLDIPQAYQPLSLGLASTLPIPGVVIEAGRSALQLVLWLQSIQPVSLHFIAGAPDGLILEAGLVNRWVLATFEDAEVEVAAVKFEQRKQAAQGLHFLLVQPDASGITQTGFWLLRQEET